MTDIKVDTIASLMPLGSRAIAPTAAFATYLDQAWCCTTETTIPPASPADMRDSPARSSSARDETAPRATDRTQRERNERDEERIEDRAKGNAVVGGAPDPSSRQDEPPASADAVGENEPSVDAVANGDDAQTHPDDAQTQPAEGQAQPTEGQAQLAEGQESAQTQQDSPADANGQSGNEAGHANSGAAELTAMNEAASGQAADAQAADSDVSKTFIRADQPTADTTQAPTETTVSDQSSGEAASQEGTETGQEESGADTPKTSVSQDSTSEGEMELDGENQPDLRSEASRSQPRYEGPIAGREPGTAPESQANGQPEAQTTNAPGQATTTAPPPSAAAIAAATTTVDTSSPPAPATSARTGSVESVEGVTAETTTTASATRGTGSNTPASEANQTDGVNRARFVQRIARAFQANGDKDGTIRMRLSPPELGSLRAEITVRQGVMNARLETETEAARQLVLENLPALQERLAEQGIKVEQFQVDVADQQAGDMPDQMENRANSDSSGASEGDARRHTRQHHSTADDAESSSDRRAHRADELGRLDVLV